MTSICSAIRVKDFILKGNILWKFKKGIFQRLQNVSICSGIRHGFLSQLRALFLLVTVLTIITRNTWLVSGLFRHLSQEIISFRHWSVILIVVVLAVKILPNFIRSSCLVVEWFSRDTRQSYICVPTVSGSDLGWPPPPSPTQLSQHHFNTWQ